MRVVKEAWLLQDIDDEFTFKCMQNTSTPKLYVSEQSAKREASYQHKNDIGKYKPVKAFLVIDDDQPEFPF